MIENIWKLMAKLLIVTGVIITAIFAFAIAKTADSVITGFMVFILAAAVIGIYMFIPCLLLFSVGELFGKLRISNENTCQIYKLLDRSLATDSKNTKMDLSKVANEVRAEKSDNLNLSQVAREHNNSNNADAAVWICSVCSAKNNRGDLYCTSCGNHK